MPLDSSRHLSLNIKCKIHIKCFRLWSTLLLTVVVDSELGTYQLRNCKSVLIYSIKMRSEVLTGISGVLSLNNRTHQDLRGSVAPVHCPRRQWLLPPQLNRVKTIPTVSALIHSAQQDQNLMVLRLYISSSYLRGTVSYLRLHTS